MNIDTTALAAVAQQAGVPTAEVADVVLAALKDAYDASPGAQPGVTVTFDPRSGQLALTAADGSTLDAASFGVRATHAARQAIVSWMRNVERLRKVGKWAALEGTALRGTVKNLRRGGDIHLEVDGIEAVLTPGEAIATEELQRGQVVSVLLLNANVTDRGTIRLSVSRRQPALIAALFEPLLARTQSQATIVTVAREPGVRSKVVCAGPGDPRADLIGPGGMTARAVLNELGAERLDLIAHSTDLATYVTSALSPAQVVSAEVVDPARRAVVVRVTPDQLPVAQGSRGVNLRLASKVTGARIELTLC